MAEKANEVIARFGGQSALARALGVNQSTVQHWSKTGHVPSWRWEQIERVAQQRGVPLAAGGLGGGSGGRPVMGYGRAAASPGHAPVQAPAPMVHGRADTVINSDREIGALREEIGQLRSLVEQLVGAVDALKEAGQPKRRAAAKDQRASTASRTPSRKSPSKSGRS